MAASLARILENAGPSVALLLALVVALLFSVTRRLQAGAVGPTVEVLDDPPVARPQRRRTAGLLREFSGQLDLFWHGEAPELGGVRAIRSERYAHARIAGRDGGAKIICGLTVSLMLRPAAQAPPAPTVPAG